MMARLNPLSPHISIVVDVGMTAKVTRLHIGSGSGRGRSDLTEMLYLYVTSVIGQIFGDQSTMTMDGLFFAAKKAIRVVQTVHPGSLNMSFLHEMNE
jgi:hypothetical protein